MGKVKRGLRTEFVPLAKPLLSAGEGKQKVEVTVYADGSRENSGFYAIERDAKLEPLYLGSPVATHELTADEQNHLTHLGNCELSTQDFVEINHAINRLIIGVAFAHGDQAPKALKERMDTIRLLATELRRELGDNEFTGFDREHDETIISGVETISHYLGSRINILKLTRILQDVTNICKAGSADLAPLVSTRGSKGDRAIHLFLATIFSVLESAGVPTTLPSNSNKERLVTKKFTNMSLLCHELCKLAGERGIAFLQGPRSAAVEDRRTARIRFKSYCTMSQGAIVDKLRLVKRNHKEPRQGLQQVAGFTVDHYLLRHQIRPSPYRDRFGTDPIIDDPDEPTRSWPRPF